MTFKNSLPTVRKEHTAPNEHVWGGAVMESIPEKY